MISAPYIRSSWTRSEETFSGITQTSRYPRVLATMAREMPVLPLVGSRMVSPGRSRPDSSASRTMNSAGRSLMLPVGLRSSSLAHSRTDGAPSATVGESRGRPTSGVPPQAGPPAPPGGGAGASPPGGAPPRPPGGFSNRPMTPPRRLPAEQRGHRREAERPARHGGQDGHRVAVGHLRVEGAEEADVLV